MANFDAQAFVGKYTHAWALRDPGLFAELWDDDGVLIHPTAGRPPVGAMRAEFDRQVGVATPDLTWQMRRWAAHGESLFLEWSCTATIGAGTVAWDGVDVFTIRDGRIIKEMVYCDTMPLWTALDPSLQRSSLLDI